MKQYILAFTVSLSFLSVPVLAQTPVMEKVLLPVHLREPLPGAFGSIFTTQLTILNTAQRPVLITGLDPLCQILCVNPPKPTPPGITYANPPASNWVNHTEGILGFFLFVEKEQSRHVRFQLRAQDISRQGSTWGTEIPVVRESDAMTGAIDLVDIPVSLDFRLTLRLYDFDSRLDALALVRVYRYTAATRTPERPDFGSEPDQILLETIVNFRTANSGRGRTAHPGYAELTGLSLFPELEGAERIRVQIQPITPGLRHWAFFSITHNETQNITIVSPY